MRTKFLAVIGVLMALVCAPTHAQFSAGQVLRASQLNSAIAAPTITGGSINGAPIGQSTAAAGAFTALTATGSFTATGLVTNADLAAQAANTVLANVTGSTASPTAFAMPSCSNGNQALRWTSGSGFGCTSTMGSTTSGLNQFAATTSAQLAGVISDETGTGALVFANNPTIAGATFSAQPTVAFSNPRFVVNDSTSTSTAGIQLQASGTTAWNIQNTSSSGTLLFSRYVAGVNTDNPISINNSTGVVTMPDGLTVNGTVSGTGFSNYLASPPAIGSTAPNTGSFTNLTSSGTVSGAGFNNYLTSTTAIGLIDSMTNAKAYGALGNSNGTHGNGNDDTTALQNALNASANGILHIPCGTYRITATLAESSTNNYWIQGDGQCTKIYNDASTAVPTFQFNPSTYNGNVNPTIKISGINFITPNVSGGGQTAVTYQNESAPHFTGNIVQGYQVGLSYTTTYGPIIDHNSFYSMKGAAIDCSIDASCNNAQIHQNGFFSNGIANSDAAIKMSSPTNINGFSVIGNDVEGNYGGIIASNASGGVIAGNYIENQTGYNLWFASGNSSIDINGNWLGASPALTLQGLSNSVFQNNAIYNYSIGQGTTTSVRQINNTTTGTGSITLPTIGQLNSNTTSGTSMTSNTPVNCTSITLPPGTWDVSGTVQFSPASTTVVNYMHSSISLTSATMAPQPNRTDVGGISATGSNVGSMSQSTPVVRETFATSTPVYLVGNSQFTTSTQTCNGYIRAVLVQ
ncbi:beta strand repeat-containing protein [Burkholderia vietnamiensis]|uniref:beta strand repeat-containing protein n=1 Tax=Burkholderia vietnamiensis TaxID=60552 RepID=UPI001CF0F349|nr:NosD domain-containing protein [Burkholderia vietnamiensis]MCA8195490.1 hypothetical protein [Burkholderia vietnamiensis]